MAKRPSIKKILTPEGACNDKSPYVKETGHFEGKVKIHTFHCTRPKNHDGDLHMYCGYGREPEFVWRSNGEKVYPA